MINPAVCISFNFSSFVLGSSCNTAGRVRTPGKIRRPVVAVGRAKTGRDPFVQALFVRGWARVTVRRQKTIQATGSRQALVPGFGLLLLAAATLVGLCWARYGWLWAGTA